MSCLVLEQFCVKSKDFDNEKIPLNFLNVLLEKGLINEKSKTEIIVCLQEATINAHEHGNLELESKWKNIFHLEYRDLFSIEKEKRIKNDYYSERTVELNIFLLHRQLKLSIRDQGKGFGDKKICTNIMDNADELYGRGIILMKKFMDQVVFEEQDKCLTLIKNL